MSPNKRTFTATIVAIVVIMVIVLVLMSPYKSEFHRIQRSYNSSLGSSCTTHDNETGVCVARSACASNTDRPSSELRQSAQLPQCDITYVCCAQNRVSDDEITPTTDRWTIEPNIHPSIPKSDEDIQYGMAILFESECGEDDAFLSESPWMALLLYTSTHNSEPPHCSGSLITNRYVMTAAHCISGFNAKLFSVRLGGNTGCSGSKCVQSPFQEIKIEEAIYHKDYNPRFLTDDIGLIRLAQQAHTDYYVRPICLPMTPESQKITLDEAELAAWSRNAFDIDVRMGVVLKKAKVQIKDNDYCQQIFRVIRITEKQVCAVGTLNGFESGVSGGPLYISPKNGGHNPMVQYGVLSGGERYDGVITKSSYSKVISYLTWIAGNIRP